MRRLLGSSLQRSFRGTSRLAPPRRALVTLAIETSCDDTCVAVLERHARTSTHNGGDTPSLQIHHEAKITSNNVADRGIHPLTALHSHRENLARMIDNAMGALVPVEPANQEGAPTEGNSIQVQKEGRAVLVQKPDFITVTRGPGMRSSLSTGLDTAKGLSVAWQRPLVAVHHMQAHALTPRLVNAMHLSASSERPLQPAFPFGSLLVSGGHTLFIHSRSLTEHPILAATADIAVGECLDKIARIVLPADVLASQDNVAYGRALEVLAFPRGEADYQYDPPVTREQEVRPRRSRWGWALNPPLVPTRSRDMAYSFSGLCTAVDRIVQQRLIEGGMGLAERQDMAREVMRVAFEHLASRVVLGLDTGVVDHLDALVVSGGVAANKYLRHVMESFLSARGYGQVQLNFPPLPLCTDNAVMIGWAGFEMFEAGWTSDLGCQAINKWTLDPRAPDGGILGVPGWLSPRRA